MIPRAIGSLGSALGRRRAAFAAALAFSFATGLLGCSGDVAAPGSEASGAVAQMHSAYTPPPPSFLAAMPDAPERVAHAGLRRVEYHVPVDGVTTDLVYDERVVASGDGRYAIDTVQVLAPSMSAAQREIFEALQFGRQGFFFKYRDLRVRDVDRLLENYMIGVAAGTVIVAGVECVELQIDPRQGAARSFRMAVHAETGLVLRSVERDESGVAVASVTFTEITFEPKLDDVEFHVERYVGTPLPAGATNVSPQILPVGYRATVSETFQLDGDDYLRCVYDDGLQQVLFLRRDRNGSAGGQATTSPESVTVRVAEVGAFRVAEAVVARSNFFVVGKISESDVLEILRSAL